MLCNDSAADSLSRWETEEGRGGGEKVQERERVPPREKKRNRFG
jgi:hypothetical protein